MKVFKEIGSKDRFTEVFQKVNKVTLNEAFGQSLDSNAVLSDAFNQLKSGNLSVKHSNTQANGNESFVELVCLDKENNNITFTFKATLSQGDQEGVFSIDNAMMTNFSFDDATGEDSVEMDENALKQFNAGHASEIADVVDGYVDVEEPVDADMDEQYMNAIQRIDAVPYKAGSERMVKQSQYGNEKPTNPALRAGDKLNKFVKEEMDDMFNPEEIETGFQQNTFTDVEEPEVPEVDNEPIEDISDEKKQIILQAYDSLIAKNAKNPGYSPTYNEVMDEIEVMTGQKVVKEKTRVYPKEAEPWLEEGGTTTTPATYVDKMLSPEKKREYISKANDFLETQLGAEKFFSLAAEQRNALIKDVANQMFFAEMTIMNEEKEKETGDYPDPIGKKFKPKSHYPKKKKKPQTTVNISETEGEEEKPEGEEEMSVSVPQGEMNGENDGMSLEPKGDEVEQLAQDKEMAGDEIEGGKADDKIAGEFDPEQILMGIEVEMEHTDDPMLALEIAMDHLTEIPDYYTRLKKMEAEAGIKGKEKPKDDDKTTNVLLGFEPKNVGDEVDEEYDYAAAEVDYENRDAHQKYLEYSEKDFNNLRDDEKEEYFELWKQFKDSEKVNETPNPESGDGEPQLSDYVDAPGTTEIWYVKPEFFRYLIHGFDDVKRFNPEKMPDANNLEKTHALLGTIAETDPEAIFHKLNNWGGEEENGLLKKKGLSHTSMSVGDIIKVGNKVLMVDGYGFKELNTAPDNVNTTGDVTFGSSSITEGMIKKARLTLSNSKVPTGLTKKEAVQILIKNNTKGIL